MKITRRFVVNPAPVSKAGAWRKAGFRDAQMGSQSGATIKDARKRFEMLAGAGKTYEPMKRGDVTRGRAAYLAGWAAGARETRSNLTDRALRYRAHAPGVEPAPPKQCGFCGSRRNVIPHHILGNESETHAANLMWACKKCNGAIHHKMRKAKIGRLTHQFNPRARGSGSRADKMKAYGAAIKVMRGEFEGDVAAAVRTIRATPSDIRSAFTARSWPVRRQMYGPSGRQKSFGFDEVPF